jgi:hypothetical protein
MKSNPPQSNCDKKLIEAAAGQWLELVISLMAYRYANSKAVNSQKKSYGPNTKQANN